MKISKKTLLLVLSFVLIGYSCVPYKKMPYVQSESRTREDAVFFVESSEDLTIKPGDELYIRVSSSDEGQTSFSDGGDRIFDPSLLSYNVDDDGFVKMPYIGRIRISNFTLSQAADTIEKELSQYLYYPSVFIKFVNNKITVLGEVNNPGVYVFNYKNVNILQAIGYAGDISDFGNRSEVLIIRNYGDSITKHYIDLTDEALLTSEMYILKSNDIVYIEPLSRKRWGLTEVPYNLIISVFSTTLIIFSFFINLYN